MLSIIFISTVMLISNNLPVEAQERSEICKDLKDYKCMRNYFSLQSTCDPDVYGSVLQTFKYMFTRTEILSFDTSFVDIYAEVINLDSCYVTEFASLSNPKRVLLTLDCRDVTITFNRTALRHRDHKLDQVFRYSITIHYPFFRMVTYFPGGFISACQAYTFTEILKATSFKVKAHDKISQEFVDNDIIFKKKSRKFVDVETLSPAWGATLTNTWLNLKICNFGCFIANQYSPDGLSVRFTISESATAAKYTPY